MPIMTDILLLNKKMQPGVLRYIKLARERLGIELQPVETLRSLAVQMAYYARGRAPVEVVQAYFERCGLWKITPNEAAKINTKTLYSKHIDGWAIDIAPVKNGKIWWACPQETWEALFKIAEEECGLDACAGGKFEAWQWDWPHHEFREEVRG